MSSKENGDNVLALAKDWCSGANSETFTSLLQELIFHLSGKHKDEVFRVFQKQLQKLRQGCNYDSLDEADEYSIAEELKNKIASNHGEKEAKNFLGVYRHLRGSTLLSNLRNTLAFMQRSAVQESPEDTNSSFDSQNLSLRNITIRTSSQVSRTPFASTLQRHPDTFDTVSPGTSNFASNILADAYHSSRAFSYAHDLPQGTIAHLNGCPVVMPVPPPSRNPYKMSVPETVLIQELIYCFQGIGGKILIEDPVSQGFKIDPKVDLRPSVRQQVLRLAEVGWLHNQVRQFCDATRPAGLVNQSLVAALHDELTEYYRLIAVLQSRLQKQSEAVVDSPLAEEQPPSFTLSQLAVCVRSPMLRLRLLLSLAEACRGRRGGALASCVHSFLQHGDPNVRRSVRTLLAAVCRPMYVMLSRWILDGELEDPYNEFFIAANPDVKGDRLWHDKYYVQEALVPSFISLAQARKILATGKSINFLREVCQDHTPIKGREALRLALESTNVEALFVEDEDGELQAMLEQAYRETSRRVLDVLNTQYKFMDHLQALRRYLLLGQGDFIRHLMELLEPELAKPASQLYPHCLSGILDSAVRSTNAQYEDEDILQRLDVRLLEMSKGDTGWDVFTLDYHVVGPIGTRPLHPLEKVHHIKNWLLPSSFKELRCFLGAVNYYQRHLPGAADLQPLLTDALAGKQILGSRLVPWTDKMTSAFSALKDLLAKAVTITHLHPDAKLFIMTDVFAMNMSSYLMLFNALWRAKRMEFVLSLAVKRQLTAAKQMRCLPGMKPLLQRLHLLISEMVHFVHQVQYYTLFEVLECSWEAFNKEVQQAEGLDDVIRAHDAFLATVRAGAFLDEGTQSLAAQLRSVYDLMLQLQGLEEQLHNRASVELEARKEYEKLVEKSGTNITMEERESTRVNEFTNKYLPQMRTQLSVLAKSYQDLVKKFLLMLTSQPELTLQLLSFRLDFNEHYRRSDSRLNAPLTYQHRRLSELGGKHLSPTCVK